MLDLLSLTSAKRSYLLVYLFHILGNFFRPIFQLSNSQLCLVCSLSCPLKFRLLCFSFLKLYFVPFQIYRILSFFFLFFPDSSSFSFLVRVFNLLSLWIFLAYLHVSWFYPGIWFWLIQSVGTWRDRAEPALMQSWFHLLLLAASMWPAFSHFPWVQATQVACI